MTQSARNAYDRVAYPSMAHPQTFAGFLSIKGFLRGVEVAPPERARVLELGCGDGLNLAAMAVSHPGASYTGIDYSAEAIARGRRMLAELGLQQIRLETADIRALDALNPPLGEFDYIVAHGVYSWVPADVRDAVLATIGRLLAPQGVAFVSYLALPGSHMRELVRTIIRFHTRSIADPQEQVRQSRTALRLIATGSQVENHYTRWVAAELDLIEKHSDEGLFHDELSAVSCPLLFTDFLAHADSHRLHFLSEAEYLLPVSQALTDEARDSLRPLEANRLLLEQYLDFMEGRRFRQTLLCRPGLGGTLESGRLDRLWVSCQAVPASTSKSLTEAAPIEFHGQKNSVIRATRPQDKAALLTLTEHPGLALPFPALLSASRERMARDGVVIEPDFDAELRLFLCRACLPGLVDFSWGQLPYTLTVPDRPCAHPLALWLLRRAAPSVLSYTGRFVEVNGALGRHLLSLLDGSRDHAALLAAVRAFLSAQHDNARAKGETANLPSPGDPALEQQLQDSLKGLAGLGLFRRE